MSGNTKTKRCELIIEREKTAIIDYTQSRYFLLQDNDDRPSHL